MSKKELSITELDEYILGDACAAVIDALSRFPSEYKLGALHTLLKCYPGKYKIEEWEK